MLLTDRPTYWLTDLLTPSDKRDLIMAKTIQAWFFHYAALFCPKTCIFTNYSSSNAGSTNAYLCSPLCSIPSTIVYIGENLWYTHYGFSVRAMLVGTLNSYAILCLLNVLEVAGNQALWYIMTRWHTHFSLIKNWGTQFDEWRFRWIDYRDDFPAVPYVIYNTIKWVKEWSQKCP